MVHTYGTNMQQSAWQLFSPIFSKHGNSAKGKGRGRTQAFHRALAKIHSKKFKFIQNILLLRVYKNVFYWVLVNIYISYLPKKQLCSALKCSTPFLQFFCIFLFLFRFPKKVNKAIVTTQDPYTIQTLMYLQSLTYRSTVQNY